MTIPDYKILTNGSKYIIECTGANGKMYYDFQGITQTFFESKAENAKKYSFKFMAQWRINRLISRDIKQQQIAQLSKKPWVET